MALERTERPTEDACRFLSAVSLQATQNHGRSLRFRQSIDFIIENVQQLSRGQLCQGIGMRIGKRLNKGRTSPERKRRAEALSRRLTTRLERDTSSDAVQPSRKRIRLLERMRPASQYQENCLQSILGLMGIAENAPAHTQHHIAMTSDQRGKGRFIPLIDVALQKPSVGAVGRLCGRCPALHLGQNVVDGYGHDDPPRCRRLFRKDTAFLAAEGSIFSACQRRGVNPPVDSHRRVDAAPLAKRLSAALACSVRGAPAVPPAHSRRTRRASSVPDSSSTCTARMPRKSSAVGSRFISSSRFRKRSRTSTELASAMARRKRPSTAFPIAASALPADSLLPKSSLSRSSSSARRRRSSTSIFTGAIFLRRKSLAALGSSVNSQRARYALTGSLARSFHSTSSGRLGPRSEPGSTLHSKAVKSSEAERTVRPSGPNSTCLTQPLCPARLRISVAVDISQILTVPSIPLDASHLLSAEKDTEKGMK